MDYQDEVVEGIIQGYVCITTRRIAYKWNYGGLTDNDMESIAVYIPYEDRHVRAVEMPSDFGAMLEMVDIRRVDEKHAEWYYRFFMDGVLC